MVHRRAVGQAYRAKRSIPARSLPVGRCGNMPHRPCASPWPNSIPTSGDIDGNTAKIIDAIADAAARGADLLVTPEMAIPGYCIGDLVEDAGFLAANERALQRVAAAATSLTAIVGFIDHHPSERNDNGTILKYNAAAVVSRRARPAARAQVAAAQLSLLRRQALLCARARARHGRCRPRRALGRLGVSICEDMWDEYYAVKPLPELAAKGADLLVNINASPFYPGKRQRARRAHPPAHRAARQAVRLCQHLRRRRQRQEHHPVRRREPRLRRRRPAARRSAGSSPKSCSSSIWTERRAAPSVHAARRSSASARCTTRWSWRCATTCRKTGFTRAIVAVSGGIDSALALAIAVDALGAERVSAFNMPSRFNTETTRSIAAELARTLGVRYGVIPIQGLADQIQAGVLIARAPDCARLHAREPAGAYPRHPDDGRIERYGALLISCGNETEIALGYATLYGDMCGGISLIGDLSKTDVYRLARHVNARHGAEKIPEATFTSSRPRSSPTNQFDPFDYAVVAPLVGEMVERRRSAADLLELFERRALDPEVSARRRRPDGLRQVHAAPRSRPCSTTPPAGSAGPSTSASRARRSSSSRSGRLGSTFGRRSSMAGRAETP